MSTAAVRMVQAAYALEADDQAFGEQVATAASELVGGTRGAYAIRYQRGPSAMEPARVLGLHGLNPGLQTLAQSLGPAMPLPAAEMIIVRGPITGTMTDIVNQGWITDEYRDRAYELYRHTMDAADLFAFVARVDPNRGMVVGVPLGERRISNHRLLDTCQRISAHLVAGLRLRLELSEASDDAIFDQNGELVHAQPPAQSKLIRETLRRAVELRRKAVGELSSSPEQALEVWKGLVRGQWSLVDIVDTDGKRFIVARRNSPQAPDPRALTKRERQVASRIAVGHSNKLIAYELGLSTGRVGAIVGSIKSKLGLGSRAELVRMMRHYTKSEVP